MASLIDGFQQVRAAHRAQVQADRRLPIEDQASASAAAAPESSSAAAAAPAPKKSTPTAPRGRARTRAQGSMGNKTKDMTYGERERSRDRDATPEFPRENTVLLSDFKRATKTPQKIMRDHFKSTPNTCARIPRNLFSRLVVGNKNLASEKTWNQSCRVAQLTIAPAG